MSLMNTTIQLQSLLQRVLESHQEEARLRGDSLSLEVGEGVPETVSADLAKLTQALNGLVQQSIVRTEEGRITLRVCRGASSDAALTFSVEDTGWEPDAKKIGAVLDPKASAAQWREDEKLLSIAMPLRLSAKFVSILGGTLEMTEPTGGGVCFAFTLFGGGEDAGLADSESAKEETELPDSAEDREAWSKEGAATILLVDDVKENRDLLEVLLKKLGYQCRHSSNGKEAVDFCNQRPFDIILMDLQMPVMDGFEATRQIRGSRYNAQTPIIAMTASGQKGDDLKALDAGCTDCLGKPISRERLQRKVWRLLAQSRQMHDAEEGKEIMSFLEGDPDYQKAVETFVDNLPGKIEEMRRAFEKKDLKELAFKAHALKGLGGFAGFPVFTEKAKSLEEMVKAEDLDRIREQLDEMVQLCMRTKLQNKK